MLKKRQRVKVSFQEGVNDYTKYEGQIGVIVDLRGGLSYPYDVKMQDKEVLLLAESEVTPYLSKNVIGGQVFDHSLDKQGEIL